jgi:hypothetical protein
VRLPPMLLNATTRAPTKANKPIQSKSETVKGAAECHHQGSHEGQYGTSMDYAHPLTTVIAKFRSNIVNVEQYIDRITDHT